MLVGEQTGCRVDLPTGGWVCRLAGRSARPADWSSDIRVSRRTITFNPACKQADRGTSQRRTGEDVEGEGRRIGKMAIVM